MIWAVFEEKSEGFLRGLNEKWEEPPLSETKENRHIKHDFLSSFWGERTKIATMQRKAHRCSRAKYTNPKKGGRKQNGMDQ